MKRSQQEPRLFVDAPLLSPEQKAEYTEISVPTANVQSNIEAVVGEYKEDGELYYYARFKDSIIHKVRLTVSCICLKALAEQSLQYLVSFA